jgi:hypothetical protein
MHAKNNIVQKADNNRLSKISGVDDVSSGSHNYKAGGAIHIEGKTYFAQGKEKAVIDSPNLTQIQSDVEARVLGSATVFVGSEAEVEISSGATMKVEAMATMDINANAPMTIGAPLVKIN